MSRFRRMFERLSDYHLLLFFGTLLALGGTAILLWLTGTRQSGPAPTLVGAGLWLGALSMGIWALLSWHFERRRRAGLNSTVDRELGDKWGPGFARVVAAYDKPWYLLCGKPAVGKTAALRAANLPMALGPDGKPITNSSQGLTGTYMFDWWFFEDAVVLDSAGDLIENPDQRWMNFLDRIRDARPIQPINGMIMAVAASDLMGDAAHLRQHAVLLARQVQVARDRLKVRFPLYLLVTKSDLITGFADFFPLGADLKSTFQILGWSNPQDPRLADRACDPGEIRAGLDELVARIRGRRSALLGRTSTSRVDARRRIDHLDEMFAFPESLEALLDNLQEFLTAFLGEMPPTAAPFPRGVYFTSALRTGEALDIELRKAFGLERLPPSRGTAANRAYFIRDLFLEKIIPESGMVTPLENVVASIRRRGRTLASGTVAAALLILIGTAIGYLKTADQVRPHAKFWDGLAVAASADRLSDIAVFDERGRFRGNEKPSLAGGDTVLAFHARAADLAGTNTASWLLPLSRELDAQRADAHALLFRELVLLPTLRPAAERTSAPTESPGERSLLIASELLQRVSAGKVDPKSLAAAAGRAVADRSKAAAADPVETLSGTDAARLQQLLTDGVARFGSQPALAPNDEDDTKLSRMATETFRQWLDASASAAQARADLIKRDLSSVGDLLLSPERAARAGQTVSLPQVGSNESSTVDECLSRLLRDIGAPAVNEQAFGDRVRVAIAGTTNARVEMLLQQIRGTQSDARVISAGQQAYKTRLAHALQSVADVAAPTLLSAPPNPDPINVLNQFGRENLEGKTVADRFRAYGQVADTIKRWHEEDDRGVPFGSSSDPRFFRVRDALGVVQRQLNDAKSVASADLPIPYRSIAIRALDEASRGREREVWQKAFENPGQIWASRGASHAGDDDLGQLIGDVNAYGETRSLFDKWNVQPHVELSNGLEDVGKALLSERLFQYLLRLSKEATDARNPRISSLDDVSRSIRSAEAHRARVDDIRERAMHLGKAAEDARLGMAGQRANDIALQCAPIDEPPALKQFTTLLQSEKSALAVRQRLLQKPADLEPLLRQARVPDDQKGVLADYWRNLLKESVAALVRECQPFIRKQMLSIHEECRERFPLCNGTDIWEAQDLQPLLQSLYQLRPRGTTSLSDPLAVQIRDVELVNNDWAAYIDWVVRLSTYLGEKGEWSIQIERLNGSWQSATLRQGNGKEIYRLSVPGRPVTFQINANAALSGKLTLKLLSGQQESGPAARLKDADAEAGQPWWLARLVVARGYQFNLATEDMARNDTQVRIKIEPNHAEFPKGMPASVPAVPSGR